MGDPEKDLSELNEIYERTPAEVLGLSVRAGNCLRISGCKTLADVLRRTDEQWLKLRNLGKSTLSEIKEKAAAYVERHHNGEVQLMREGPEPHKDLKEWAVNEDPLKIPSELWGALGAELRESGLDNVKMRDLAFRIDEKWPSSRRNELLRDYTCDSVDALWARRNLGRKKIRIIIRCALACWMDGKGGNSYSSTRSERIAQLQAFLVDGQIAAAFKELFDMAGLTEKEKDIIFRRYGISPYQSSTLEQIGTEFGVTRERIRQLESEGLKKLVNPPDLRKAMEIGLQSRELQFLAAISSDVEGFIESAPRSQLRDILGAWETLLVEVIHDSLIGWLNARAAVTEAGWVWGPLTVGLLEQAKQTLVAHLEKSVIPVPVSVAALETSLSEARIRAAAIHGGGHLIGDFICLHRLQAKEVRALALHTLTRFSGLPILKRKQLPELATSLSIMTGVSQTTICRQVGCFPKLLVCCGSEYAFRVTPKWEIDYPELTAKVLADLPCEYEPRELDEDTMEQLEGSTLHDMGIRILESKPYWRVSDLADSLVRMSRGRLAGTSIGQVLLEPAVQRFAPGLWGLKRTEMSELDYELLLNVEDCSRYIEGCRASADKSPFPMWNPDMEFRWCRWASEHAPEAIYHSLLAVISPDDWNCSIQVKEHWRRRQRERGHYRLERPPLKSLAQLPVSSSELVAAVGAVVGRGGTSWIDLNVVHGRTIDSHRAASSLALLIALDAIRPSKHWQRWHEATSSAAQIYSTLCNDWIQQGGGDSSLLLGSVVKTVTSRLDSGFDVGWVNSNELRALMLIREKVVNTPDESEVTA